MSRAAGDQVFGLHPSSRGFGWVFFEARNSLFDWGTADMPENNSEISVRIGQLLEKYRPDVLAMEAFADRASRRGERIRALCWAIVEHARDRRIDVRIHSRSAIHAVFPGSRTRQDVAASVAAALPMLAPKLPSPRKPWESERANAALFAAAACALTEYAPSSPAP